MLGGITVVGCEAEGATAVPQTAGSPGKDEETGKRSLLFDPLTLCLFIKYQRVAPRNHAESEPSYLRVGLLQGMLQEENVTLLFYDTQSHKVQVRITCCSFLTVAV